MKEKTEYYRRLDIVRILSCILVLLYHLNIVKWGFLAVCTFFTLSGFLSCVSALKNKKFSIRLYYINRIKKLYIPLLIIVVITVIIAKINSAINWINLKPESCSVLLGYNNIWQLKANQGYFRRNINSPFTHLWYISILFQFDLIFPIAFIILKKIGNRIRRNFSTIIVIILTIITIFLFYYLSKTQGIMIAYYNSFSRSFSLLFGVLLALILYKHNMKISRVFGKYKKIIYVIYLLLLIALCVFIPDKTECYAIFMLITTVISTRLIEYSIYEDERINRSDNYLKLLSRMSYEVYLVQYPVIFFMQIISINDILKKMIISLLTVIIAFVLRFLIEGTFKKKKFNIVKNAFIGIIVIVGIFTIITSKDYSKEMKDLENRLNENLKFIEDKNKEFLDDTNTEAEENSIPKKTENEVWNAITEKKVTANENVVSNNNDTKINDEKVVAKDKKEVENVIRNSRIVGIGDSVMLDATKEFYNKFPKGYFDGKINRTISKSKEVLTYIKSKGKLGNIVILCLSTNGDYSDKQNTEMMKILGNRKIYWINAAGPDDPKFNEKFANFAKNYPNIHIIEWDKFANSHPEYLEPDKIHPNYKGGKVLVQQIFDAICDDYLKE